MKWVWPTIWVAEGGKWGRVAATLLLFIGGMLVGNALILLAASAGVNEAMKHQPLYLQQFVRPLAIMIASSMALVGCLVGVRFVHHKSLASVFTDGRRFRFSFALQSALLWLVLWFASTLLLPDRWERVEQRAHELPLAGLLSLAVAMFCATSVQGTLEEVVFRGYLQPRVGAWVGRTWVAVVVVGSIFTAVHIDAWTGPGIVYVAGFSAAFGVGGVRAGSLAPLCGLHAAHNAMEFLWFPHESNNSTTWPQAALTAGLLSVWLIWLFWMSDQRRTRTPHQEVSDEKAESALSSASRPSISTIVHRLCKRLSGKGAIGVRSKVSWLISLRLHSRLRLRRLESRSRMSRSSMLKRLPSNGM